MVLPQSTRVKGFGIGQRVFKAGTGPSQALTVPIFGVKKVRQEDMELAYSVPYEPLPCKREGVRRSLGAKVRVRICLSPERGSGPQMKRHERQARASYCFWGRQLVPGYRHMHSSRLQMLSGMRLVVLVMAVGRWPLTLRLGERIPESDKVLVHMKCCQARVMVRHGLCLVIRSIDGPTGVCVYRQEPSNQAQDVLAYCGVSLRQDSTLP